MAILMNTEPEYLERQKDFDRLDELRRLRAEQRKPLQYKSTALDNHLRRRANERRQRRKANRAARRARRNNR